MMAVAPRQSDRVFRASLGAWLVMPVLCLLSSGCFMPRDYSAWSPPAPAAGQWAILPVLPEQVRITLEESGAQDPYTIALGDSNVKNKEEVARTFNEVLDTISAGNRNTLQNPAKTEAALQRSPSWKTLQVYLQDPGPLRESWKRDGLATISREIGLSRVVQVAPILRFKPNLSPDPRANDPLGHHWDGTVSVELNILELTSAQVVASGAGDATFYGHVGALPIVGYGAGLIIPYAFGKAFDRAVDQAIRKALAELLVATQKEEKSR